MEHLGETERGIREWCIAYFARTLKVPTSRIDPDIKFARLGIDSAMAITFLLELEEWLGRELTSDLVFEYPSIAELARHLVAGAG